MIEFKAECGHTVRARDEDAGGVVRCSYCGRPANVPDEAGDDLDFLFNDVTQPQPETGRRKRRLRLPRGGPFTKRAAAGEFNPFPVVLRLCYAALLLIIVIFVGRLYVVPFVQRLLEHQPIVAPSWNTSHKEEEPKPDENTESQEERPGLFTKRLEDGTLYVLVTPRTSGVIICIIEQSEKMDAGPYFRSDQCTPCPGGECTPVKKRDANIKYTVEVAARIAAPALARYPGHTELRKGLRAATAGAARDRLVADYFIPDGSIVRFHEVNGQEFVVRQYPEVVMRQREPTVIHALFLPRLSGGGGSGYSIERLVQENYIPNEVNYGFDVAGVEGELDLDGVPESEHPHIIRALRRIGAISYVRHDRRARLMTIDASRGWVGVQDIGDQNQ